MSPWPAAVGAEPKTLHMLLDADARLAAAAGGVARFLADEAGLETGAAARLQLAFSMRGFSRKGAMDARAK